MIAVMGIEGSVSQLWKIYIFKCPTRTRKGRDATGALPVLEPLFELRDRTLLAADVGEALRRMLGPPELCQVFAKRGG